MSASTKITNGLRTFASDVVSGLFEVTHNGFAMLGLVVAFTTLTLTVQPEIREIGETRLIQWLQARHISLGMMEAPSEIAGMTEIHETVAADMGSATTMAGSATTMGAMTMKPVAKIALPAGKAVELKPGGYHVMLMKLAKPLTKGQTFDVELTFEKAGKQTVKVEVRDNA